MFPSVVTANITKPKGDVEVLVKDCTDVFKEIGRLAP
jgi:hypothetical protein